MDKTSFRYQVLDRAGERVASAEWPEEATRVMRLLPSGAYVVDVVTGAMLAYSATGLHGVLEGMGQA